MAKQQQNEEFAEVFRFPFQGIDLSTGRDFQRPGTTPVGNNVRSYDALTLRRRGGTRGGLTPLFGAGSTTQVSGTNLIQHLNQIVWVTRAALSGGGNAFGRIINFVQYAEVDHPPERDSPTSSTSINWFVDTSASYGIVSDAVVGVPDGGGTGKGTAHFSLVNDGTNVILTATFVSAGFPPPAGGYFFPNRPETFTMSLTVAQYNAGIRFEAFWNAIDSPHGYIGVYSFSIGN